MSRMYEGCRAMVNALNDGRADKMEGRHPATAPVGPVEADGWITVYHTIAKRVADTVVEKQAAYGDSFTKSGDVLRILFPDGIPTERMNDALTITRVVDKLFRAATMPDAFGESPWLDVAGYALLAARRDEAKAKQ